MKRLVRSKGGSLNRRDNGGSSGGEEEGGGGSEGEIHVSWAGEEGIPKEETCNRPWGNRGPSCSKVKHWRLTEVKTVTKSVMVLLH